MSVAALHYNENCDRQQAITKNGEQYFSTYYPKAKKGTVAVVKPRKTPPTFGNYINYIYCTFDGVYNFCLFLSLEFNRIFILVITREADNLAVLSALLYLSTAECNF